MPRFLLDTNILIYIRQRRPREVQTRFGNLRAGEAAISVVTYGELIYGIERAGNANVALVTLQELVSLVPVLPLPVGAAKDYGRIRAELSSKGQLIGNNDLWIAAHAMASELILVTNNVREFRRVPDLTIENWAKPGFG